MTPHNLIVVIGMGLADYRAIASMLAADLLNAGIVTIEPGGVAMVDDEPGQRVTHRMLIESSGTIYAPEFDDYRDDCRPSTPPRAANHWQKHDRLPFYATAPRKRKR